MQAKDILTATRKLEESGMTRSQSEAIADTIIAAVAPLATKDSLEDHARVIKAEFFGEIRRLETKLDIAVEHMATKKDVESINTRIESINTRIESIYTRIESVKVWLISGLLGACGGMLAIAVSVAVYAFRIAA